MENKAWVAQNLAAAFLSGDWSPDDMVVAALPALGRRRAPAWLHSLAAEVAEQVTTPYPPSKHVLAQLILRSVAFARVRDAKRRRPLIKHAVISAPQFAPLPALRDLGIPELTTVSALAEWLDLRIERLDWFADVEGYRASTATPAHRHYDRRWVAKKSGAPRLIEAPKPMLKAMQRRVLHEILDPVPVHENVHGYRKGRSCVTAARCHAGEEAVISADLQNFFPSISAQRVHGVFRSLGFTHSVARCLTGLCTTITPADIFVHEPGVAQPSAYERNLYRHRHLPQGAPTSPSLANLCAWRLDRRLSGLADHLGVCYTRYGDDLAFSGDREFVRRANAFLRTVAAVCADAGFSVNHRKTRVMRSSGRQRITGLVVNRYVNVSRDRFDKLKATLHNCVRHGPIGQNLDRHADFQAHLVGQIAWVENVNPYKGDRLRRIFEQIRWS